MRRRTLVLAGAAVPAAAALARNPLPLGAGLRTADPSAHVWKDGRLYLYTSHDEECQHDFHMKDWCAFSTADLQTWVNHGPVLHVKALGWADDLRSTRGPFIKMDMGGYEPKMEGPWVFRREGIYYFTMPEGNRTLTHYTAPSPQGPWRYRGVFMEPENGNNHHSIVQFQGRWLQFYHRWLDTPGAACAKKQRHVAAEFLHFEADGRIRPVQRTTEGLAGAFDGPRR